MSREMRRDGLSRLLPYTTGRRGPLGLVLLLAALSAAAPVAGWHVIGDAIDNGIRAGDETRLLRDVLVYVAIGASAWVLGTATWLMLAGIGQQMVLDLRRDLFEHLTSLSLRYFSQQKAGWIIARLTSDVDALSDVLNQGLTTLVVNTLTLVAAVGGLFLLDWRLGLVALLVLPPGVLVTRWFQRRSHTAFSDVRTRIAAVTAQLAESVAGMAVVQAFTRERGFQREFEGLNEANRVANVHAQKLSSVFFPAIELLGVVAQVAVLYAGARMIDAGSLEIGTLIAAAGMLSLVFQPLQELSELYGQVQAASAAMGKISTVLDAAHDIEDRPSRPRPRADRGAARARRRRLRLRRRARPPRNRAGRPGRRLHRARRGVGRRQVDDGEARRALLRPRPGRGARGRDRSSRRAPAFLPPPARSRAPGSVSLQRHDRGQPPVRTAGGDRRGDRQGRAGDRRRPRRRPLRGRARACRSGGRLRALGRRASAHLDRPRARSPTRAS